MGTKEERKQSLLSHVAQCKVVRYIIFPLGSNSHHPHPIGNLPPQDLVVPECPACVIMVGSNLGACDNKSCSVLRCLVMLYSRLPSWIMFPLPTETIK